MNATNPISTLVFKHRRSDSAKPSRIAVVGSGIAGLSAAWALSSRYQVVLYEGRDRLGGHSNTVDVPTADGPMPVDTGFIVYNERNYPNLTSLFSWLDIKTQPSDMSFAVSIGDGRFEYSGSGLNGLAGDRRNLLRPRFWRMLADVLRFYRMAPGLAANHVSSELTLGELLARYRFSAAFRDCHLLPMAAAIWSSPVDEILACPAVSFINFFANHGLLDLAGRPEWRTVLGGSRRYVAAMTKELLAGGGQVRRGDPVVSLRRRPDGVSVATRSGAVDHFDQLVVGAHADQALAMLVDASDAETEILGTFRYQPNRAVLHRDPRLMPRRRRVWSSWNYLGDGGDAQSEHVSVTYWMNRLQNLDRRHPVFVSLNPLSEPRDDLVVADMTYDHPVFDVTASSAWPRLAELQGRRNTWFCGSYFGYGFHEDAVTSGLNVARALDAAPPWEADASPVVERALPDAA